MSDIASDSTRMIPLLSPEGLREFDRRARERRQAILDGLTKEALGRPLTGAERKERWRMTHPLEAGKHERDRSSRRRAACGGEPMVLPGDCCTYHKYYPQRGIGMWRIRMPDYLWDELEPRFRAR